MFDHYSLDLSTCKLQKFEISVSTLYSFSLSLSPGLIGLQDVHIGWQSTNS